MPRAARIRYDTDLQALLCTPPGWLLVQQQLQAKHAAAGLATPISAMPMPRTTQHFWNMLCFVSACVSWVLVLPPATELTQRNTKNSAC
jgi:hypothetical protein